MSDIIPYVRTLYFISQNSVSLPGGYHRRDEFLPHITEKVLEILNNYEINLLCDPQQVSDYIFDELVKNKVLRKDQPQFAGVYYIFSKTHYDKFRNEFMKTDGIASTAQRIGKRYFPDVFAGYRELQLGAEIPAADRLVSIDHNSSQFGEIRDKADQLLAQLSQGNDLGNMSEEDRVVARGEVSALSAALSQPLVRWDNIRQQAIGSLTWIGREAAGAIVGAIALGLLALLAAFFGFTF